MLDFVKRTLPDRPMALRVWRGPFRGARIVANPRSSLRKLFGLYEHELNGWIETALSRVTRVVDVGANDGYFTLGCAAALHRRGRAGQIIAIEPQARHVDELRAAIGRSRTPGITFEVVAAMAGAKVGPGMTTLDALAVTDRRNTLIKIDVEGAEGEVIAGARLWTDPSNLFVIEVHSAALLADVARSFAERGAPLVRIDQRPLPWLGRDVRDANNWWLVSPLRPAQP
jgi:hypothetical protein